MSLRRVNARGVIIGLGLQFGLLISCAAHCLGQDFVPMFNGKDLSGWVRVNTPVETWTMDNGMLVCTGKPIGELRTERMYQNFEMELEWRHMVPKGNAGVFVWADDITSRGVPFHRGIEVQVLENAYGNTQSHTTHGDIFPIHGAQMTPVNGRGGSRAFPTEERSKPSPEWNHYRIVCQDGAIALSVNGKLVTQGRDAIPRKGYICLESEGGVVHYRNVRIKELPASPIDEAHVAIANRGYQSIYSGLDLRGWRVSPAASTAWRSKDWVLAFDGSVSEEQSRLEYSEPVDLRGFVVDFRMTKDTRQLTLSLPGNPQALRIESTESSKWAQHLEKPGGWNRIEGSRAGAVWSFTVNNQPVAIDLRAGSGAYAIESAGPIELANLFIR